MDRIVHLGQFQISSYRLCFPRHSLLMIKTIRIFKFAHRLAQSSSGKSDRALPSSTSSFFAFFPLPFLPFAGDSPFALASAFAAFFASFAFSCSSLFFSTTSLTAPNSLCTTSSASTFCCISSGLQPLLIVSSRYSSSISFRQIAPPRPLASKVPYGSCQTSSREDTGIEAYI